MAKRIIGLDIAKTLAMLGVITIHYAFYSQRYANRIPENIVTVLTNVAVPMFFMINGFLLFNRKYDEEKHLHKILRMLEVLIVWKIVTLPTVAGIQGFEITKNKAAVYLFGGAYDSIGYFWFINALIAVYIIFPILKYGFDYTEDRRIVKRLTIVVCGFVFGVNALDDMFSICSSLFGLHTNNPFSALNEYNIFGKYSYVLAYFLIGGMLSSIISFLKKHFNKSNNIIIVLTIIVSFAGLFALQRFQAKTQGVAFYVINGYQNVFVLLMSLGTLILLLGAESVGGVANRIFSMTGANTLGVYYLHYILIVLFARVVSDFQQGVLPLIVNLLVILLLYGVALMITLMMKHIPIVRNLFLG